MPNIKCNRNNWDALQVVTEGKAAKRGQDVTTTGKEGDRRVRHTYTKEYLSH